ncbi:MAG: signal recognition particle-docking protein FtsY [Verrucomicrobiae bacterium]|nr:signal recognition particle-docking protein FtsY [Verrucomicrobiae bacterium]
MLGFFKKVAAQVSGKTPNWEEIEAELIQADFGAKFAIHFVENLKEQQSFWSGNDAISATRQEIKKLLHNSTSRSLQKPMHVIVLVGVNGVGKTTSAAKLAQYYQQKGNRIRLVAGDTFRAAAIEQLKLWGEKIGVPVTAGNYGGDSAALAFSGYQEAQKEGANILIIDTAGRQHTKANLMQELAKLIRVLKKAAPDAPHETLLVIDAATGSNALNQAREFQKHVPLSGVIATKMDGAGTGGSLVGIASECQLQPLWMGVGEKAEDFLPFDVERYLEKILGS